MPRKPNYRFERHERERVKAEKKAAKAEKKAAKSDTEKPVSDGDSGPPEKDDPRE
jgi:hypothetical protein